MKKKVIKKIVADSDQAIMAMIKNMDNTLTGLINELAEYGTIQQDKAVKNMLERNLELLNRRL